MECYIIENSRTMYLAYEMIAMATFSTTMGQNTTRLEDIRNLGLTFLKFKPLEKME